MDIGLKRRFVDACDWIIEEVGLIDYAIGRCNLTAARDARAEHGGALELSSDKHRIDDESGVDSHVDTRNSKLSLVADFDLNYRCYIGHEAAMNRNSPSCSAAALA